MRILISETFSTRCPHFVGAAITGRVSNSPHNEKLWAEITACGDKLRTLYDTATIKERPGIKATREAYKTFGKDPSRYRPACEQLARRILQGKSLYAVDTLVDIGNLVSLEAGYSTAALDASKIESAEIVLGIGERDEPYEAIGRGVLNIENLPVYRDALGGFATPTSDSVRTMIAPDTHNFLLLINGYDGNRKAVETAADLAVALLSKYADGTDFVVEYY